VVWRAGRFDFAALQDRLRSGRVRGLVAAEPAGAPRSDRRGVRRTSPSTGSAGATAPDSYASAAICTPMIYWRS